MKKFLFSVLALVLFAAHAFADVTVSLPANYAELVSPFVLSATASPCNSQAISAMGYSLDNSTSTTIIHATSVSASVQSPLGNHVLHVKSWGTSGASCVTNVNITVVPDPASLVPTNAVANGQIQDLNNWRAENDTATGSGTSTGTMTVPGLTASDRKFYTTFTSNAGERYHVSFGSDTTSLNFLYDAWIYLGAGTSSIANLELDMNQTVANGQTVIYGFQCDGYSHTWDFTKNGGTPASPKDQWVHSTQACNLQEWGVNKWHHVQISYSRDVSGNVTYKSVYLDGVGQDINVTVPSSFALGWGSVLLTNYQIDGLGTSGAITNYLDNLTIYRW